MANKKISQLDSLGTAPAGTDIIPITDVDDTTGSPQGTTKRVTVSELLTNAPDNSTDVTLAAVNNNYLTIAGQEITAGIVPVSLGGTGSGDLATARANLGVAAASHTHFLETDLTDVTIANKQNEDVIKWNGSSFVNGQVSVDVDTPLNTALRGTVNPHIGAYPNQSFKVIDNPDRSVMVVADADGNLTFVVSSDTANIKIQRPTGSPLAASFGFSVEEDSSEPDIEVQGTLAGATEKYSVISGDSDSLDVNGLPIRQGFNNPDIGAFSSPILISGGSIA